MSELEVKEINIGVALRQVRQARGWSQGEIEERSGLRACYVSRVENGYTIPMLDTLAVWCKALGIPVWELVRKAEENRNGYGR